MDCLQSSFFTCQFTVPRRLNRFRNKQCIQRGTPWLQKAREATVIYPYFQAKTNPEHWLLKIDSQQFSTTIGKLSTAPLQNAAVLGNNTRGAASGTPLQGLWEPTRIQDDPHVLKVTWNKPCSCRACCNHGQALHLQFITKQSIYLLPVMENLC